MIRSWLAKYKQDYLALLFFLILTIVAAWVVVSNLNSVIIGRDNDVFINPWADWWTQHVLSNPDVSLWETDYLFYPQGANLTFHSFSHLNTFVSLLLRPIVGILPAYNITILINYVLSGFAMFQLARYLTKSAVAGILAGIVFAFNSHSLYQSAHPVLVSIWCFPWLTLSLIHTIEKDSIKWALVAALFVGLGSFSSTLLLILMGVWILVFVGYIFITGDWPRPSLRVSLCFGIVTFC